MRFGSLLRWKTSTWDAFSTASWIRISLIQVVCMHTHIHTHTPFLILLIHYKVAFKKDIRRSCIHLNVFKTPNSLVFAYASINYLIDASVAWFIPRSFCDGVIALLVKVESWNPLCLLSAPALREEKNTF